MATNLVSRGTVRSQIPLLNLKVYILPFYMSVFVSIYLGVSYAVVIFTGGVGKNGSTVAVRSMSIIINKLLHCFFTI